MKKMIIGLMTSLTLTTTLSAYAEEVPQALNCVAYHSRDISNSSGNDKSSSRKTYVMPLKEKNAVDLHNDKILGLTSIAYVAEVDGIKYLAQYIDNQAFLSITRPNVRPQRESELASAGSYFTTEHPEVSIRTGSVTSPDAGLTKVVDTYSINCRIEN
jgi:hypothetical protein